MKTSVVYLVLAIVTFYKVSNATHFEGCFNPRKNETITSTGKVTSLDVQDCPDDAARCPLPIRTNQTISFTFIPSGDAQSVTSYVNGVISASETIKFPLPHVNACEILGCPLKSGETYTYENILEIPQTSSGVDVNVRWGLMDESQKFIVCFEVPSVTTQ